MEFDFDLIDDSCYTHGCLDDEVCEQTFEELLGEYECGDADPLTIYRLGKFYINGIGVEEDSDEGIRLVTESAESGLAEAQNELGRYYDAGEIVEQDLGEAFKWFSKAADQDMSAALFNLGRAYENGYGVDQDAELAFDYYLRAAERGFVRGEFEVGCAYDNGIGVDEDKEEAHAWYLKAAEHGNAPAQFNVAWNYEHGEGVELDEEEAFAWYLKAADQGYAAAQNNLGVCYEYGRGTPIDIAKAEDWYRKSADQGDDDAKENLVKIRTATEDRIVAELDGLIGLDKIKENVRRLFKLLRTQAKRRAAGLKVPALSYHCVFSGNPGTGKTTVARILAKIYQATGVVKTDKFVEAGREDLVAEWLGQTAIKTNELIDSALDGVLFIDEAYSLANLGAADNDSFGREAIETLLRRMENDRDRLVVIVAGYTNEMNRFIDSNPGLKSRFTRFFEFPDYSAEELSEIFKTMAAGDDYDVSSVVVGKVRRLADACLASKPKNFGNARDIRKLYEETVNRQAERIDNMDSPTERQMRQLRVSDVPDVMP